MFKLSVGFQVLCACFIGISIMSMEEDYPGVRRIQLHSEGHARALEYAADGSLIAAECSIQNSHHHSDLTSLCLEQTRIVYRGGQCICSLQVVGEGEYMWTDRAGYFGWGNEHTNSWRRYKPAAGDREAPIIAGHMQKLENKKSLFYIVAEDGKLELYMFSESLYPQAQQINLSNTGIKQAVIQSVYPAVAFVSQNDTCGKLLTFDNDRIISLPNHKGVVHALYFSSDGSRVVTAGEDGIVHIADVLTGQLKARIPILQNNVTQIMPPLTLIANRIGQILGEPIVDEDHDQREFIVANDVFSAQLSHDGHFLATFDIMHELVLWDVVTGGCLGIIPLLPESHVCVENIPQLRFSPDDQKLLVYNMLFASEHDLTPLYERERIFSENTRRNALERAMEPNTKKRKLNNNQNCQNKNAVIWLMARELGKKHV